ncbi:ATP-binding protein [bacterium]|nr:MAG: ATP-binding protein [bacterium]
MQNIVKKYVKREVFDDLTKHLDKPEITLLTGSRQVGKTVLLEQLKDDLIQNKGISVDSIFYYNLDLIQDWEIFQDQKEFIEFLRERSKKDKIYVLVDEAQKVPEATRFFKGVYDSKLNVKLILTGSSSLEIKVKFKETLAGRKRIFKISPFTFFEFLKCKDEFLANSLKSDDEISKISQDNLLDLYKEYIIFGGYPRVILAEGKSEKISILKEIYSSYVEKDALGFLEIKNKTAFNRLIKLLAAQIGQLVNIEELATNLGINRESVERYIFALEETFIIKRLTPYYTNPRQEIIKAGKIYFLDLGIRNLALENFNKIEERIDKSAVLENAVFNHLLNLISFGAEKIYFWRTKQKTEVDFVIEKGLDLLPIEVKFSIKKENTPSGLANFIKKFDSKKAVIANLSMNKHTIKNGDTEIDFLYPFKIVA